MAAGGCIGFSVGRTRPPPHTWATVVVVICAPISIASSLLSCSSPTGKSSSLAVIDEELDPASS